jgi:hypothetical protein
MALWKKYKHLCGSAAFWTLPIWVYLIVSNLFQPGWLSPLVWLHSLGDLVGAIIAWLAGLGESDTAVVISFLVNCIFYYAAIWGVLILIDKIGGHKGRD